QKSKKKKAVSQFLQAVFDIAVQVSKEVAIPAELTQKDPFEKLVGVLTAREALDKLAPSDPLAAARLKGVQVKRDLLYAEGNPLTSEAVASLLHLTRQAVDKRRKKGQLLGISLGRRGYLYPVWQFHEGKTLGGLEQVLAELSEYDPWTQLMFFKTGDLRLDGATPLERLNAGEIDRVVWAASCYGKQIAA
ncbi:MAG: hypothetical protein HC935_02635, partial [Pseudanabaena sp. SU_2_4]|nr:hypothetical protein [Pseudanabaena sp. SU_2_4]